jgi:hypothetical protein
MYHAISKKYSLQSYLEFLCNYHGVNLHHGNWGTVISPPHKHYVYKLWLSDPPYEHYYEFCRKNQQLSFVPRITKGISVVPLVFDRDSTDEFTKVKVGRIEKLYPISRQEINSMVYKPEARYKPPLLDLIGDDDIDFNSLTEYGAELVDEISQVPSELKSIYDFDTNDGNIMKTITGRLILSDPILDSSGVGISKLYDTWYSSFYYPKKKQNAISGRLISLK